MGFIAASTVASTRPQPCHHSQEDTVPSHPSQEPTVSDSAPPVHLDAPAPGITEAGGPLAPLRRVAGALHVARARTQVAMEPLGLFPTACSSKPGQGRVRLGPGGGWGSAARKDHCNLSSRCDIFVPQHSHSDNHVKHKRGGI